MRKNGCWSHLSSFIKNRNTKETCCNIWSWEILFANVLLMSFRKRIRHNWNSSFTFTLVNFYFIRIIIWILFSWNRKRWIDLRIFSDSSDIVDCKLKLILGLIWTLILHYSISLPMWEGEDDLANGGSEPTPKQRWVFRILKNNYVIKSNLEFSGWWIGSRVKFQNCQLRTSLQIGMMARLLVHL